MRRLCLGLLAVLLWATPLQAQDFYRTSGAQTLSAAGNVELDTRGMATATITVTGLTGTVTFEVTNNRQLWSTVDCAAPNDATVVESTTTAGIWTCPVASMRAIRARVSVYTSGVARSEITAASSGFAFGVVSLNGVTVAGGRLAADVWIQNGSGVTVRNNAMVEGGVARDADASALYPLYIGGCASTAIPAAVSADGDGMCIRVDRNGHVFIRSADSADLKTRIISGGGGDPADDKTQIKATAGTLTGAYCRNSSTTADAYLKFTNALAASTTVGTTAVFHDVLIPAGASGNNQSFYFAFDTALTAYFSVGPADTDSVDVPNNEVSCSIMVAQ